MTAGWVPGVNDELPTNDEIEAIPSGYRDPAPLDEPPDLAGETYEFHHEGSAVPVNFYSTAVADQRATMVLYPKTEQAKRCMEIAFKALDLFNIKNAAYGEPTDEDLGSRGQYADMHRKWKRLRSHLWDGEPWPEEGEPFLEVLYDFIGHLLLTADFKERGL